MIFNSSVTAHLEVVCSDDVVRRFHYDPAASMNDDISLRGHVFYRDTRVDGFANQISGYTRYVFAPCKKHSQIIPKKSGFKQPKNCAAPYHCSRTNRCVGGCKP